MICQCCQNGALLRELISLAFCLEWMAVQTERRACHAAAHRSVFCPFSVLLPRLSPTKAAASFQNVRVASDVILKPSIKDVLLRLKLPHSAVPSFFFFFLLHHLKQKGKKKFFPDQTIPICFSFTIRPRRLMDTRRLHLCRGAARGRWAISRGFPLTGTWV